MKLYTLKNESGLIKEYHVKFFHFRQVKWEHVTVCE